MLELKFVDDNAVTFVMNDRVLAVGAFTIDMFKEKVNKESATLDTNAFGNTKLSLNDTLPLPSTDEPNEPTAALELNHVAAT